jgi:hypothetical protein
MRSAYLDQEVPGALTPQFVDVVRGGVQAAGMKDRVSGVVALLTAYAANDDPDAFPIAWHQKVLAGESIEPTAHNFKALQHASFAAQQALRSEGEISHV